MPGILIPVSLATFLPLYIDARLNLERDMDRLDAAFVKLNKIGIDCKDTPVLTTAHRHRIIIYCDGACSGNQSAHNVGGWGVVLKYGDKLKEIYGGEHNTTNQRMELTACIKALETLKTNDIPIDVYSDSAYLINCMKEQWHVTWQKNGWKNAKKQPVENKDLWKRLLELVGQHSIRFHKVAGHAGVELNERADELAQLGIQEAKESS